MSETLVQRQNTITSARPPLDIAPDVLRHRIAITYKAEAQDMSSEDIVQKILSNIPSISEN